MIETRKHCADAECRAVVRAETCADARAEFRAIPRAVHLQKPVQMFVQSFVQIVRQKRWLKRQNEAAMLHFVSNRFNIGSLRYKIAPMQKDLQNIVQMSVQKHGAERRWKPVQVVVQNTVQSLMQMLVQIIVQKKWHRCRNELQKAMQYLVQ